MTASPASNSSNRSWLSRRWKLLVFAAIGVVLLVLCLSAVRTAQLVVALETGNLSRAEEAVYDLMPYGAVIAPRFLGDTYILSPVRTLPNAVIHGIGLSKQLQYVLQQQQKTGVIDLSAVQDSLIQLEHSAHNLQIHHQTYPWLWKLAGVSQPNVEYLLAKSVQALHALRTILNTNGRWLIVLQNTDELRATGGFMGSYILLTIEDQKILDWVVEDIYDADGQFTGFLEAPPGANEYLSSARGLRLPDANWSPDFPTSAQHVLQFFALGDRSDIQGVTAVNLTFAENLLAILGPITLPDYDTPISSDTIATALRSERQDFFAGSISKKHLLQQLLVQLQMRLNQLSAAETNSLATATWQALHAKDLQFFAIDPELQQSFEQLGAAGLLQSLPQTNPIMLVESNVGINKANRGVKRTITIDHQESDLIVRVNFTNNNFAPSTSELGALTSNESSQLAAVAHNGYINYLRLFVLPGWQMVTILQDDEPISLESERELETHSGDLFTEFGTLIRVPEQTHTEVEFRLKTTEQELAAYPIDFIPQSGIPDDQVEVMVAPNF